MSAPAGAGIGFLQEVLPLAFTALAVGNGGTYNAASGTILWGPLPENQLYSLSYTLTPPSGFQSNATVSGTAYFYGTGLPVVGDSVISLAPPPPRARLSLVRVADFFAVSIQAPLGHSHRLEARDNLASGQWETLTTINMTQSPRLFVDTDSIGKPQRFYRAVLLE